MQSSGEFFHHTMAEFYRIGSPLALSARHWLSTACFVAIFLTCVHGLSAPWEADSLRPTPLGSQQADERLGAHHHDTKHEMRHHFARSSHSHRAPAVVALEMVIHGCRADWLRSSRRLAAHLHLQCSGTACNQSSDWCGLWRSFCSRGRNAPAAYP